ncbi:MAG: thiamine phosphate synthase [Sphingomonadales bacterium]|nr:MAG: thiamine phosphate synthase [Sphingomonadales bacterium]
MRRCHPPIPKLWLMSDERMGDGLWRALERLPRGSGVVFRHYSLGRAERIALFRKVVRVARRRKLVVLRAGSCPLPGERGTHNVRGKGITSWAVHDRAQGVAAARAGADVVFVSPMFATASHPGAPALGRARAGLLIRGIDAPAIALGGMDAGRAKSLKSLAFHGWAAIDAWTRG